MFNQIMKKLGEERSEIREIFEYGLTRAKEIGAENVFDFSLGNPNVPAPECVDDALLYLIENIPSEKLHGYTSAAGAQDVRQAVAEYIQTQFGVPMRAELVYVTCGAAASLTATLNALCEEGDEFIVVTPYFPEYKVFIERAGGRVKEVASDSNFQLDTAAIANAITPKTKGIIINSPNNPTGAVYGQEELSALSEVLNAKEKEYGAPIFLIADEPYRELTYGKEVPYPMNFYDNTIVCYSFSKSLSLAGERIGYVAINPACEGAKDLFFAVCGAGRALGYVCAPALFQRVCAKCLGQSSDIQAYRKNRDLLYNALTGYGYECVEPSGAFYLFVKSPEEDAKAFCERAKKYELLLVPSDSFGVKGYVRISYCVSHATIQNSLPSFEKLIKEYM